MNIKLNKLTDKITAIIVFIVVTELAIGVALGISCMFDYHFYASDRNTYAILETCRVKSESDIEEIVEYCKLYTYEQEGVKLSQLDQNILDRYRINFAEKNTNIRFTAMQVGSDTILTNKLSSVQEEYIYETYVEIEDFLKDGTKSVTAIKLSILSDLSAPDDYRMASRLISIALFFRYPLIVIFCVFVLLALFILGVIMNSVSVPDDESKRRFIDKIPLDILAFLVFFIFAFLGMLVALTNLAEVKSDNIVLWNAIIMIIAFFVSIFALVFNISVATRIKQGHVFRNTFVFRTLVRIRKRLGKKNEGYFKVPFIGKAFITVGVTSVFEIIVALVFIYQYFTNETGLLEDFNFMHFILIWAATRVILIPIFYMIASNISQIRESGQRIAEGDLQYDIESNKMFGDFRKIGGDLTKIKDEIIKAVDAKNKSLMVRDELITNLSHDIKTPLTSIVNYADLLKTGNCSEEDFNDYLQIIGNQSHKLKKLLESLIEVSKLTTGDVAINLEPLDIVMFTGQMICEFEDRFETSDLSVISDFDFDSKSVSADPDQLMRVFENLFSNAIKYAKPGTRVFVKVFKNNDEKTSVSVSNVSKEIIGKDSQALLQRFSRGDSSRHTEGYGLGLSIAKTLIEFQGGTFDISIDGDLFKTIFTLNNATEVKADEIEEII
ncbi:MAG: GHKL domain-containing protein [Clostridia bacterium]|nr:GHKL domain-containing protein [Clostridia bacterium]